MKAISVRQPWASMIAQGTKTIETRTWPTKYRGDLLIVSSKKPKIDNLPLGHALCVVEIVECRPMVFSDEAAAGCKWYSGAWAWVLEDVRPVEPVAVRGQLGIYEVDDNLITADCSPKGDTSWWNCNGRNGGCEIDGLCF